MRTYASVIAFSSIEIGRSPAGAKRFPSIGLGDQDGSLQSSTYHWPPGAQFAGPVAPRAAGTNLPTHGA